MDHWQQKQNDVLRKVCQPHWHYADIGACRGDILGMLASMMVEGEAFEANPENYEFLKTNFENERTRIHHCVVSNKIGTIRFYLGSGLYTGSTLECDPDKPYYESYSKSIEVPCTALDDFYQNKQIDFIKMDVEGAEWDVFEGAQCLLKDRNILWQVEFHFDTDWNKRQMLFDLGYNIYDLDFNKLTIDQARPYQAFVTKEEYPPLTTR